LRAEADRVRLAQTAAITALAAERTASGAEAEALTSGLEAARAARDAFQVALAHGAATADDMLDAEIRVEEMQSRLVQWKIRDASLDLRMRWQSGEPIIFTETTP